MNQFTATRSQPLRLQFLVTSLPVGGAEILLANLIERLDRNAFAPEVICLKEPGALAERLSKSAPLHSNFIRSKWDLRVLPRLAHLFRRRATDAVITVGAGDKMFWGRLAAKAAGVPVVCSALHSTGWPDGVGKLNRLLTRFTDAFIACASTHAAYLIEHERFPATRVHTIPNGVDTQRFRPDVRQRAWLRAELEVPPESSIVGIVAALRPEKNHFQFVAAAREIVRQQPAAQFVIVGEGPERTHIEEAVRQSGFSSRFHFLGNRADIERLLAGMDVFCLTSLNEATPVSILEAAACGLPVISPDVGSVRETVIHQKTGILTRPLSASSTADAVIGLLGNPNLAARMGHAAREHVRQAWSLESMVQGYEELIGRLYNRKVLSV